MLFDYLRKKLVFGKMKYILRTYLSVARQLCDILKVIVIPGIDPNFNDKR